MTFASTPVRVALLAAAALMVAVAFVVATPATLARGWLLVFALAAGFPLGCLVLLMIHCLTGGRWGEAAAPVLRAGALMVPAAALAFLPIALALPSIYPWAADPAPIPASVAAWYLNPVAFWTRAAIALGVWSILGVVFGLGRGGPLVSGLGLAISAVLILAVSVDWLLSVDPRYVSSAFALLIATRVILTAVAVVAVVGPPAVGRAAAGDVATLLATAVLGCIYLELMTFIVGWYGNLPTKAAWYLARSGAGWSAAIIAAVALALIALVVAVGRSASESWQGLRIAGAAALGALGLETAWLIVPAFAERQAVVLAALGGLAVLVLLVGALWPRGWMAQGEAERGLAPAASRGPSAIVVAVQHAYDEAWRHPQRAPEVTHHATMPIEDMHEREALEDPAVENRPVLASIAAFMSLVVVCVVVAYAYVWVELRQRLVLPPLTAPAPQLQADPSSDLRRFETTQGATLSGYGWVDQSSGIARIPIEQAMEIIARRGNAAFDSLSPPMPAPQRSGALP